MARFHIAMSVQEREEAERLARRSGTSVAAVFRRLMLEEARRAALEDAALGASAPMALSAVRSPKA